MQSVWGDYLDQSSRLDLQGIATMGRPLEQCMLCLRPLSSLKMPFVSIRILTDLKWPIHDGSTSIELAV